MISSYAQAILAQSKGRHLLIDSNLLLLLLLGSVNPSILRSFKRLSTFRYSDFQVLVELSRSFKIATTAHVLTEVSNLANALPHNQKEIVFPYIASRIKFLREDVVYAIDVATQPEFSSFGLTDAALSRLSSSHLLITDDGRLAHYLRGRKNTVLTLSDLNARKTVRPY